MLKLNASYAKKVPAEGEYSSQSYHASVEVELPDGLTQEQLNSKIHETFALVRESVEAELHGVSHAVPVQVQNNPGSNFGNQGRNNSILASPKQISYLLSLARQRGVSPQQLAAQYNVPALEDLSKRQCSEIINNWRAA